MEMPFGLIKSFIFFSFMLSVLSSVTFLKVISSETSNQLISQVCTKTRNPRLCSQILNSNRRANKASSLLELGKVAVDLSRSSAQATKNKIIMLRLRTGDREKKEQYQSCMMNYECAIYYLEIANHYLKGRDLENVSRYTAAALNEPIGCRENFAKPVSADLKEGNDKLECLCSVILVISNRLSGRNFSSLPGEYYISNGCSQN